MKECIPETSPFDDDVAFLRKYDEVVELTDCQGTSRVESLRPGEKSTN